MLRADRPLECGRAFGSKDVSEGACREGGGCRVVYHSTPAVAENGRAPEQQRRTTLPGSLACLHCAQHFGAFN